MEQPIEGVLSVGFERNSLDESGHVAPVRAISRPA